MSAQLKVYAALLDNFGPQGWWPVTPPGGSCPAYRKGFRPRTDNERFEICLGALLTQNTSWNNAARAIARLLGASADSPATIASLPRRRLESLVRSSGCYRQKAEKLRVFCAHLLKRHPEGLGAWLSGSLEKVRQELLSLRGVGPETADSILLYAGRRRVFVIDAYTVRLGSRMGWLPEGGYEAAQELFVKSLPRSERVYNEYHALIVELAKRYCAKNNPKCGNCPLSGMCPKKGVRKR